MALSRLARETADLQRDPLEIGSAGPADGNNPQQWVGYITGPPNTLYAQETFFFTIIFPDEYPRKPFKLTFTTPVSHPNISEKGEVRHAELKERYWSPAFTVRSILVCVQALLSDPDLNDDDDDDDVSNSAAEELDLKKQPVEQYVNSDSQGCAEPNHYG
ncbi:ubiquitin-conjugating enzyme [Stagonosporopsis vannaccii]|nr:ubiquitin-conjugating enzyme [Stagonosporopsis vannaccii]